jgi:hypothetical protein
MPPGAGKGPQGRGSIIVDHEGAPCTDSRYHRYCRGRWRGVLGKGFGPDGRRRRYKVSGRTKQDVVEALKKKSEELDAGLSMSRSYTSRRLPMTGLSTGCRAVRAQTGAIPGCAGPVASPGWACATCRSRPS